MEISARAEKAGVVREDGRPLHEVLTRRLETVVADGTEYEPLLAADRALLLRYPVQVLQGLSLMLEATQASRGLFAVRMTDFEVIRALRAAQKRFAHVEITPVEDYYPAGEPRGLIRETLGIQIPPGVEPEAAGLMVSGIHALFHLAEAVEGRPATHRFVTVAGEVSSPKTLRVPIGLPISDLIGLCGGLASETPVAYVAGGPLRGEVVTAETPILPTTKAVLVLPADHPVVARAWVSEEVYLKRAAGACGGCRLCTDRCPQHLLGYGIEPHLLMRGLVHGLDTIPEVVTGAGSCCGCLLCEAVCPAGLSPGRLYRAVRGEMRARGIESLPLRPASKSHEALETRRASREWLALRLGVTKYAAPLPVDDNYYAVPRVLLPLDSAIPCVKIGQRVAMGVLLAEGGGRRIHSPIDGVVHRIDGLEDAGGSADRARAAEGAPSNTTRTGGRGVTLPRMIELRRD